MNNATTSNEFYGGLNRRFAKRSALLRRFGFQYVALEVPAKGCNKSATTAVFVRSRHRTQVVSASEVLHACARAWRDTLALNLYRAN